MKRGVNKAIVLGNVGQNPSFQTFSNGNMSCSFSVATSEVWIDKQGNQQERTEWHRIVIFGKLAEVAKNHVVAGMKVYVEGSMQTRKYTDKQGIERYTTEVVLSGYDSVFQMLSRGKESGQPQNAGYSQSQPQSAGYSQPQSQPQNAGYSQPQQPMYPPAQSSVPFMTNADVPDDDIPFAPVGLQYPAMLLVGC